MCQAFCRRVVAGDHDVLRHLPALARIATPDHLEMVCRVISRSLASREDAGLAATFRSVGPHGFLESFPEFSSAINRSTTVSAKRRFGTMGRIKPHPSSKPLRLEPDLNAALLRLSPIALFKFQMRYWTRGTGFQLVRRRALRHLGATVGWGTKLFSRLAAIRRRLSASIVWSARGRQRGDKKDCQR
jgi:hypothetical protein